MMYAIGAALGKGARRLLPLQATMRSICASRCHRGEEEDECKKQEEQPQCDPLKFEYNEENKIRAEVLLSCYDEEHKRGALVPLLDLAQRQYGWLPITAISYVAELLKLEPFVVWEVANFYTMFNLKPVGKYCIKVCRTTPCYLRGSEELLNTCKSLLNLEVGETSKDMQYSLKETDCMGACVNGPVVSINDDMYEDLTTVDLEIILAEVRCGKVPAAGPRSGRFASEPRCGLTSLTTEPPPPGYMMQELCPPDPTDCDGDADADADGDAKK